MSVSQGILDRLMRLHPKIIDLSLDRVQRLLRDLDRPQDRVARVIHVAGTNGKGSVVAFLRAMLEARGLRVQAYTSPHLVDFNERIRLVDGNIGNDRLIAMLEECEAANDGQAITFFEITTAAAFLAFSRESADVLLLESGLGGRVDATNVIPEPAGIVLTPISLDHQQFLGDSLQEIAGEKAAILKSDVPTAVGPQSTIPARVIDLAAAKIGVPLYCHGRDWDIAATAGGFRYASDTRRLDLPAPKLFGPFQLENAGTAVACLDRLGLLPGDPATIGQGIVAARWPARMQRLRHGPLLASLPAGWELWLDGGHNESAGAALAEAVRQWSDRPLYLVVGMLNSKDPTAFLAPLAPLVTGLRAVAIPGERNSWPASVCADAARALGVAAAAAADVAAAVHCFVSAADAPSARVLICGSLYLAGKVLAEHG